MSEKKLKIGVNKTREKANNSCQVIKNYVITFLVYFLNHILNHIPLYFDKVETYTVLVDFS